MYGLLICLGMLMQPADGPVAGAEEPPLHIAVQAADVAVLGGWPLERRWYGLAVQNLVHAGARRVFIDIAFPRADPTHPSSDQFFYAVLAEHPNVYLLAEAVPPDRDSLRVLGTYHLPAGRFFLPFSASFRVQGRMLAMQAGAAPVMVQWLLPATPEEAVLFDLPPGPLPADSSFLTAVQGGPLPVQGRDVILSIDHPGVTSYIVYHATDHPFTTTALQHYAVAQLRAGRYYQPWPWWKLMPVLAFGLVPLLLLARRRWWIGGVASLGLLLAVLLVLPPLGVYLAPSWYGLLLAPVGVLAFGLVQAFRAAPDAVPPVAPEAEQGEEDRTVQRLEYRLRFYEDLERQAERQAPTPDDTAMVFAPGSPLAGLLRKARQVAASDVPVLLAGESGTGKEMLAAYIHQHSSRSGQAFVAVNCAALNENLIESELFGHEAGAFTGAARRKVGRFERAHGGTLFLDEVAETSLAFQVRLLRVLQEGVFERVGGTVPLHVSVRIIAATNRDLADALLAGRFREDLFYRLNGFTLALPPLRERTMDIVALFRAFLSERAPDLKAAPALLEWLSAQPWRGNVRELKAATERAVLNAAIKQRAFLLPGDFELADAVSISPGEAPSTAVQVLDVLRHHQFAHRSIQQSAEALSLHRITVTEYLRGWVIHFLAQHGCDRRVVYQALQGAAHIPEPSRFERRVDQYIETILQRIDDGLRQGETDAEIQMGRFKNTQGAFKADLQALIQWRRAQRA